MLHQDQVEQARKLLAYLETRTTATADGVYRNEVSDYTCPRQLAREREVFFKRGPFTVGLSCLIPSPGDYMTHDYAGVPILLVRQPDGSLRALLNVCRHRGARLAEGCGAARDFSCPYHGWTYGLDGRLLSRPDERSFAEIDKSQRGLRALPVVETDGMIWLSPTPGAHFDMGAVLGGLERDFASYRLDTYHHYETRVLRRRINWKVVIDTFLESYHLAALHQRTVNPILHSNLGTFDAFGRNLRTVFARRTIGELHGKPEAEWNLIPYSAVIYVLFPNTVFIMQGDHVETWHVFPAGDGIDESVMYVSLYTPEPALTDSAKGHWDRNFDLLMATVEKEDFPLSEGMQRGFHSGAQDEVLFGRNEPALQHFHKSIKAALAETACASAKGS
jgi:phenylpropionate dioxygenase-like ring-hydroxylating dioxygenase large terminal subunit